MISQLLTQSKMPSVPDLGGAQPAKGGETGAQGAFSLVLSTLGDAAQSEQSAAGAAEQGEGSDAETAGALAIPGLALPDVAGTGKMLPVGAEPLPEAAADAPSADAAAAVLALVPPQMVRTGVPTPAATEAKTPASAPQVLTGLPLAVPQPASETAPGAQTAVAIQVAPLPARSGGSRRDAALTPASTPASTIEKPEADLAAKLQPNAAASDRHTQRDLAGGERPAADAAKAPGKVTAEAAGMQQTAPALAPAPAPAPAAPVAANPAAPAANAAPSFAADKPALETQVVRELSRIVDSLASAREALTAKAATLAIDHAEFGELSLRFDQRRDGQLAVQLAAADPDVHRAIAAAVADRPAFAQADQNASGGQQNAQTSARGSLADREGGSAEGNAPRQERHDERRRGDSDTTRGTTSGKGTRGDGNSAIYA